MRHGLYEDPVTHKFAVIRLPSRNIESDKTNAIVPVARWFESREEALATLFDLFEYGEDGHGDDCLH